MRNIYTGVKFDYYCVIFSFNVITVAEESSFTLKEE